VRIHPDSGERLRTMSKPGGIGPLDLEHDGASLWLTTGDSQVFVIDPATGGIQRSFDSAHGHNRNGGMALRPGELFVSGLFGNMAVHHAVTGQLIGSVDEPSYHNGGGGDPRPSCFARGQLVILDRFGITFFDVAALP
jgi:hypothetical protein